MDSSQRLIGAVLALCLLLVGTSAQAQLNTMSDEYAKQIKSAEAVGALGQDLFGEKTSFYTGSTEFSTTDVSLPGNNSLPVSVGRRFVVQPKPNTNGIYRPFRDWDFDIPHLQGVFRSGWAGAADGRRCNVILSEAIPPTTNFQGVSWDGVEYWSGTQLYVPGQGEQEMLLTVAENAVRPTDGKTYKWVTAGQWYFSCEPTGVGAGDKFVASAPDGTRYWFDWQASRSASQLSKANAVPGLTGIPEEGAVGPSPQVGESPTLPRTEVWLLPTRAEDRFGNWVTYAYDATNPWQLKTIAASDGRQITITYNPSGYVATVSDGTRTWQYGYGANNLTSVTLPDNSTWQFALSALTNAEMETVETGLCDGLQVLSDQTFTGTITHPSGAQGQFAFKGAIHGRSYVTRVCFEQFAGSGTYYARFAKEFATLALKQKTITGPGLPTAQWTYTYGAPNDSFADECSAPCATTKTVEATGPENAFTRYTFGTKFQENDGKLLKVETGSKVGVSPPTILRTENTSYLLDPTGQPYPTRIGQSPYTRSDRTAEKHKPTLQRQIVQQGTTYTWLAEGFDQFASPIKATRSSTPGGYTRTDTIDYHDDTAKWVIGQLASSTCNLPATCANLVETKTDYDTNAMPWKTYAFGKLQQTLTYTTTAGTQAGTLKTATDGNGNVTTLTDWKRGIPQKITFADTKFKSAVVNNIAGIDSATDENGYKTCYGYDAMGRLSSITYPSETAAGVCDTSKWTQTTRSFSKNASALYGLPTGHWVQKLITGNARQETYFDALWRPVVVATYDAANTANTLSQTVTRYDSDGRPTFVSYPQRTQDAAIYNTWANPAVTPNALGTDTAYDALGRVKTVTQDSELGVLTTSTAYLSNTDGPYTVVANPRGFQTRTWFQAYDQPNYDTPVEIWHPEAARTVVDRDVFGKPKTLTRRNDAGTVSLARSYTYLATTQELCRTIEPETGATDFGYDAAGNLKWSAAGLPTSIGCDLEGDHSAIAPRRVDRTYDVRNRLKTLDFPDGLGDQVWTYTPDGLTDSIVTQNGGVNVVTNSYTYNRRRLPIGERLQWGAVDWSLGYTYNGNGHVDTQSQPLAPTISLAPNALGQPTQVGTFATAASYYPNGAIKQFTYGNGLTHTLSQNTRGLPDTSCDFFTSCPVTTVLNDGYDYDESGNVAGISDGVGSHRGNRIMSYDGLDRLTDVVSPMYGATGAHYGYDVLDNLTRVNIGGTAARDHYYCYDTANRLTNIKTTSCNGTSVIGLGYDVQGNLANKNGQPFAFDFGNRLRSSSTPTIIYVYDGHGRRARDMVDGGSKYSFYSQAGQLAYVNDLRAATQSNYFYLGSSLVAIRELPGGGAATVKYQHTDALGSPVAVTDANRVVIEKSEYEPYGGLLNRPLEDGPGYTGHVSDAATGLSYMQQRYYDPKIGGGRFLSVDPVTADNVGGNFNRYWYANNNPYKFVDPDGRFGHIVAGAVVGALIGGGIEAVKQIRSGRFNGKNLLIESGKGGAVGAVTAAVPFGIAAGVLNFGGKAANIAAVAGTAAAAGSGGEVASQYLKGEQLDTKKAAIAGAANLIGVGVGSAVAAPARALSTVTTEAIPGAAVKSLSGRTFIVGAVPSASSTNALQAQAIQDTVGEAASSAIQENSEKLQKHSK